MLQFLQESKMGGSALGEELLSWLFVDDCHNWHPMQPFSCSTQMVLWLGFAT